MTPERTNRLRERAAADEAVRRAIVEAAMRLYEESGHVATIGAIADAAGVRPMAVFRQFSSETAMVQACAAHWLGLNPPPDPEGWTRERHPRRRAAAALEAFYDYYSSSARILAAAYGHRADLPALTGPMDALAAFTATVAADLANAFPDGLRDRIAARLEHALAFPAWHEHQLLGLDDVAKIALVQNWIDTVLLSRDG